MNRFAALLDRLGYEPRRNAKLRLMTEYFRTVPDPERGFALAALTGALSFRHAKPGLIRSLVEERTDPVLFGLSWDYVGDMSETIALLWPASPRKRGEDAADHAAAVGAMVTTSPRPRGEEMRRMCPRWPRWWRASPPPARRRCRS